ncbi:hypothetical protein AB3662_03295 [Sorangium cellulosum]|uniref:hypothetical protein n=1 Tax=Sorangium cellulosum TaxID=56 RepID=UPI003D9A9BFB
MRGEKGSREAVRGSREAVRGSREAVRGSREAVRGSREAVRGSREAVRGSREAVRGSREAVQGSREAVQGDSEAARGGLRLVFDPGRRRQLARMSQSATGMRSTCMVAGLTVCLSACVVAASEETDAADPSEGATVALISTSAESPDGERGALERCKALALPSHEAREEFCRAQPRERRRRCWENVHASSLGWLVYCATEFSY